MATLKEEIEAIKRLQDGIVNNKVANFAYTDEAYTKNNADGVEIYNINQSQNIPKANPDILRVNPTVLTKGYRAQASSVTRMLVNHFFGRTSYNLNKVNDFFLSLLTKLSAYLGTANGIATLDSNARVPLAQLKNVTDTKGQANGIATLDSNASVPLAQLKNVTYTKGQANGIATLDSNARVPLTQLLNVTDTKGQADGIATLDSNARVPVEQLQNIINDVSASGNKTYSSNKINNMNSNLNDKIELLESKHIYANYMRGKFYSPKDRSEESDFYLSIITPYAISNFDDLTEYLNSNKLQLNAGGTIRLGSDNNGLIFALAYLSSIPTSITALYMKTNGSRNMHVIAKSDFIELNSVSKVLL